jgi:hypothetical protein
VESAGAPDGSDCQSDGQCASGLCEGSKCQAKATLGAGCSRDAACATNMCVKDKCFEAQAAGASCGAPRECQSNNCDGGVCAKPLGKQLQEKKTQKCISDMGGSLKFQPCSKGDPAQMWGTSDAGEFQNAKTGKCITVGSYAC